MTQAEAEKAIQLFNNHELQGRRMMVNIARPREERSDGGGGGGGYGVVVVVVATEASAVAATRDAINLITRAAESVTLSAARC